jgi:PhnB protein
MLIPILHFNGNCLHAIALYEKAFNTKAEHYDYGDDNKILHAEMVIHGQRIYLNDSKDFIKNAFGFDCVTHLALTFKTPEEMFTCYEILKKDSTLSSPFVETQYSKLVGNFIDKLGVLWGFMVVGE